MTSDTTSTTRRLWLWLVPLLLLTFWLGARGLNLDPIWNDEWYSLRDARAGVTPEQIYIHVGVQNPWHTPGFFIIMNQWIKLVSVHPFATRAYSLFIGLLALAWTYRLGRALVSPRMGIYAAVILGTSAFFVYHLHEIRMYTQTALLAAFTLWVYLRVIRARHEPGWLLYAGLFVGVLLLLYTHYFAALPLGAVALYHLIFAPKNRRWVIVVVIMGTAGLLFVPYLQFLSDAVKMASSSGERRAAALGVDESLGRLVYLFSNGSIPVLVVIGAFAVDALWNRERGTREIWWFALATLALVLATNAVLRVMSEGRARYLIVLWPYLTLVVALGIEQIHRLTDGRFRAIPGARYLFAGLLGVWFTLGVYNSIDQRITSTLSGAGMTYPIHTTMYELKPRHFPGDYVVHVLPDTMDFRKYTHNVGFYAVLEGLAADHGVISKKPTPAEQDALTDNIMTQIGLGREYVWLAYSPEPEPTTLQPFEQTLAPTYPMCGTVYQQPDLRIVEFARSPVCCTPETTRVTPLISYTDTLKLRLAGIPPVAENGALPVRLSWLGGDTVAPHTYSVALHALDAEGELVAQADYGLPFQPFACPETELKLDGAPPGDYTLAVIVYAWESGARLTGTLTATGEQGEHLPLGTFRVQSE